MELSTNCEVWNFHKNRTKDTLPRGVCIHKFQNSQFGGPISHPYTDEGEVTFGVKQSTMKNKLSHHQNVFPNNWF